MPLVHTAHTLAAVKNLHLADGDSPEPESRRICEQQISDNADVMVVNTDEEKNNLTEHYDADASRIEVIPPGVDVHLYSPGSDRATERSRRELGIPLHAKVILFVGRLQRLKGPQVLLRAVAELVERRPRHNLKVIICGGPSGTGLERPDEFLDLAEELDLGDVVRFLLLEPPLPWAARPGFWMLAAGAVEMLPPLARDLLGLRLPSPARPLERPLLRYAAAPLGRFGTAAVGWALSDPRDPRNSAESSQVTAR